MTQNTPPRTQAPTVSTSRVPDSARQRVSNLSEIAIAAARGKHFTAATTRPGVPIGDDYVSVLKAPAGKILILEDVFFSFDFQTIATGTYTVALDGYIDTSDGNGWGYTPVSPLPLGRPLNAVKVNDVAESTIDLGIPPSPAITGNPDYSFYFASFNINAQGNQNTVSSNESTFFGDDRKLILGPGQEMLARTRTAGTATTTTGTIRTLLFTSEVSLGDIPKEMGATLEEMGITI